ncbi:MAG: hypothetical protein AAFR61_02035 [Bacteroidota bacterium]
MITARMVIRAQEQTGWKPVLRAGQLLTSHSAAISPEDYRPDAHPGSGTDRLEASVTGWAASLLSQRSDLSR